MNFGNGYSEKNELRTNEDGRRYGNNPYGKNALSTLGGSKSKKGYYLPADVCITFVDLNSINLAERKIYTYDGEEIDLEYKTAYPSYERTLDRKAHGKLATKIAD